MGCCKSSPIVDDDKQTPSKETPKVDPEAQKRALEKEMDELRHRQSMGWNEHETPRGPKTKPQSTEAYNQLIAMGFNEYQSAQAITYNSNSNLLTLIEWIESHKLSEEEIENLNIDTICAKAKAKSHRLQAIHAMDQIAKDTDTDIIQSAVKYITEHPDAYHYLDMALKEDYMLRDQILMASVQSVAHKRQKSLEFENTKPLLIAELRSMGFLQLLASNAVNANSVINKKSAIKWIMNNPLSSDEELSAKIEEILHYGFTTEEAMAALKKFENNVDHSIIWLNQGKPQKINHYLYHVKTQKNIVLRHEQIWKLAEKINFDDPNQKWSVWENGLIKNFQCNKLCVIKASHSKNIVMRKPKLEENVEKKDDNVASVTTELQEKSVQNIAQTIIENEDGNISGNDEAGTVVSEGNMMGNISDEEEKNDTEEIKEFVENEEKLNETQEENPFLMNGNPFDGDSQIPEVNVDNVENPFDVEEDVDGTVEEDTKDAVGDGVDNPFDVEIETQVIEDESGGNEAKDVELENAEDDDNEMGDLLEISLSAHGDDDILDDLFGGNNENVVSEDVESDNKEENKDEETQVIVDESRGNELKGIEQENAGNGDNEVGDLLAFSLSAHGNDDILDDFFGGNNEDVFANVQNETENVVSEDVESDNKDEEAVAEENASGDVQSNDDEVVVVEPNVTENVSDDVENVDNEDIKIEEAVEDEKEDDMNEENKDVDDDDDSEDDIKYKLCAISEMSLIQNDDRKIEYLQNWIIDYEERTIKMNVTHHNAKGKESYLYLVNRDDNFHLDTKFHDYDMEQRWCVLSKVEVQELNPKELAKELDDPDAECIICYDNDPNVVLNPCGHSNFCNVCIDELKPEQCPICRTNVKSILQQ